MQIFFKVKIKKKKGGKKKVAVICEKKHPPSPWMISFIVSSFCLTSQGHKCSLLFKTVVMSLQKYFVEMGKGII